MKFKSSQIASLMARWNAINLALEDPRSCPKELYYACQNHEKLARLEMPLVGIYSMSRNTMYKYADELLNSDEGAVVMSGRGILNSRRESLYKLGLFLSDSDRSKIGIEVRRAEKEARQVEMLSLCERQNLSLSKAYMLLIKGLREALESPSGASVIEAKLKILLSDHEIIYSGTRGGFYDSDSSNIVNINR